MKVFGYWYQGELNPFTKNSIKQTKINNPYINYKIYNNSKARTFLKKYFKPIVLNSYDILIPKAYKSDLLRYCLLYIFGGAYLDVKLILNSIPKKLFQNQEYLISQGKKRRNFDYKPIENSFLYFKKAKHPLLKKCIQQIIDNVKNGDKTSHNLLITGPLLIGNIFQNVKPTMKFKATSMPKRKFIYTLNGTNLIDNDLTPYYINRNHETFWSMHKQKNGVFYDTVPKENKKFCISKKNINQS
jgi:mannosyltransferase OCH1-like enzyme